jgi:molecular chaperone GrpE
MSGRRPAGAPEEAPQRPAGAPEEEGSDTEKGADEAPVARRPSPEGEGPERSDQGETAAQEVENDLDALLADVRRERDEYLELAQRARADFENYRRRASREAEEAERRARADLARRIVPSLDNLERALRAAGVDPDREPSEAPGDGPASEEVSAAEALARGVRLVFGELLSTLTGAGIERYDPSGERFDPTWHEALSTVATDGVDAGVVVETVEKGYRLDGQVLRAARVIVSG